MDSFITINYDNMRRVTIFPYEMGLVFRKDRFLNALPEGKHWIRWSDQLFRYDMTEEFTPLCELNILLQNSLLKENLEVIELEDHQIALVFYEGNFLKVIGPGRHPFWKSIVDYRFQILDRNVVDVPATINKHLLKQAALVPYLHPTIIDSHEMGLLIVDGNLERQLKPGAYYFWKNEKSLLIERVDLRQQQMEISGQEILTKDKAAIRVTFFVQYRVVDVEKALLKNKAFEKQFYILIQLALREYMGTLTLDEALAKKQEVEPFVLDRIKNGAQELGLQVLHAGLRDIILPGDVKEIMNQVLVAQKQAQANLISRREETAATRSLLNTAKLLEENQMLLKLKEMEYVEKIADKINSISLSGGGQLVEQLREIFIKSE